MNRLSDQKKIIRKEMLRRRESLTDSQLEAISKKATPLVLDFLDRLTGNRTSGLTILSYMSFRGEFPTHALNQQLLEKKNHLILPVTSLRDGLQLYEVHDTDHLVTSSFGIQEPSPERCRPVSLEEVDLVFLPGTAFDRSGGRIGFGGGFYDRLFATPPHPVLVALAHSFQILDHVPVGAHDVRCHWILTEDTILRCPPNPADSTADPENTEWA